MTRWKIVAAALACQVTSSLASAAWSVTGDPAKGIAVGNARATDGHTVIDLTCNGPDRSFIFTFEGYKGRVLKRVDDLDQPLALNIGGNGTDRTFSVNVYYYSGDEAFVEKGNLPAGFLDALSQGATLSLKSGTHTIADFALTGADAVRKKMISVCAMW